jgi:hypothetical protein
MLPFFCPSCSKVKTYTSRNIPFLWHLQIEHPQWQLHLSISPPTCLYLFNIPDKHVTLCFISIPAPPLWWQSFSLECYSFLFCGLTQKALIYFVKHDTSKIYLNLYLIHKRHTSIRVKVTGEETSTNKGVNKILMAEKHIANCRAKRIKVLYVELYVELKKGGWLITTKLIYMSERNVSMAYNNLTCESYLHNRSCM